MSDEDRLRWNASWSAGAPRGVTRFLESLDERLPRRGRALDVAGGPGHDALWLAARGLDVTLVDLSDVALARARADAAARGLALSVVQRDLEEEGLPSGEWDVVVCLNYLQRSLFPRWPEALAPGGVLVFAQPTKTNLERHPKPSSRFSLTPGELAALVPPGLEVVTLVEDWFDDRHEARLVARRG